jgi:enamine deaminase RidA (YjgF/YER057c/UK114 family)
MFRKVKCKRGFDLYLTITDDDQIFITASVQNTNSNIQDVYYNIYLETSEILLEHNMVLFHERIFCSLNLCNKITETRNKFECFCSSPYTYIQGNPPWGHGIAGVHFHGVKLTRYSVEKVINNKITIGVKWTSPQAEFILLHSLHGIEKNDPYRNTLKMFDEANYILKKQGFSIKNVVRTWIYLDDILSQYDLFNKARNLKFKEFGLLPDKISEEHGFEQIYMPASTGIAGSNLFGVSGVMDLLAIKPIDSLTMIGNESGQKQKSAYRYGSAFSRSMIIDHDKVKYIYLSGTASIGEDGKSKYIGDINNQIEKTIDIIKALIKKENLHFCEMIEGTIFIKEPSFADSFVSYCKKNDIKNLPVFITISDVCRDDLLFEIDATFASADK